MKALEKDRGQRYETANGLARDLERYLADEPVEACPPTAGYRVRKFVRTTCEAFADCSDIAEEKPVKKTKPAPAPRGRPRKEK